MGQAPLHKLPLGAKAFRCRQDSRQDPLPHLRHLRHLRPLLICV